MPNSLVWMQNNSWAVLIVFSLLFLLLILKLFLLPRKTVPLRYIHSSIQLKGEQDRQSELFNIISTGSSLFAVIASGNWDTHYGRQIATMAVDVFKAAYQSGQYRIMPIEDFYRQAADGVQKAISDNVIEHNTPPSILAVIMENGFLHTAEIHGNMHGGTVYINGGGRLTKVARNRSFSKLQVMSIKIAEDETVMAASKGAANSLTDMEIALCLSQDIPIGRKCGKIEGIIRRKRRSDQDNATVIIVEQVP